MSLKDKRPLAPPSLFAKHGVTLIILTIVVVLIPLWWAYGRTYSVQIGYRGTGMQVVTAKDRIPSPPPAVLEVAEPSGVKAKDTYVAVPLLGEMDDSEFNRFMEQITAWVSPADGCYYCHVAEGLDVEAPYTKIVSRRMIEMVQELNTNATWKNHIQESTVTCYTCHRGNPIPPYVWTTEPPTTTVGMGNDVGQNHAAAPGATAMQRDPYTNFLLPMEDPRAMRVTPLYPNPVQKNGGYEQPRGATMQRTEEVTSLMMHISVGLGTNCTYCHNTQNVAEWKLSRPQRVIAWHGLAMVRQLNADWMVPMQPMFETPYIQQVSDELGAEFTWEFGNDTTGQARLGRAGDVPKVNCGTCHNGEPIPFQRANLAENYPVLLGQ